MMPLARSAAATAAASTVSSKSIVAVTWLRADCVGDERRRVRVRARPSRRRCRPTVSQRPAENSESAVAEHPLELVIEQEDRGERGRVVGLVEAGVLDRDRQVECRRHPAIASPGAARCARSHAVSRARARGRRRSRSTSAARSNRRRTRRRRRAFRPRPTCRRPTRARRCRRAGGPAPSRRWTSRCADRRRRRLRRGREAADARRASVSHTCGSSRCGAALVTAANFDENSPITRCVLRRSMSPNAAASQNAVEPPLPSSTS